MSCQTHCAHLYGSYNLFASESNPDRKPGCHYPGLLECDVTHFGRWVQALWSSLLPPSSRNSVAFHGDSRRLLSTENDMVPARNARCACADFVRNDGLLLTTLKAFAHCILLPSRYSQCLNVSSRPVCRSYQPLYYSQQSPLPRHTPT